MAELRDGVPLTDLGVITRWSVAVRQAAAERDDLIAELRADLDWLEASRPRSSGRDATRRRRPANAAARE